MSAPITLSTSFTDFTAQGARRAFCMIGNADGTTVISFESAPTLGSSSGVRIKSPFPPAVIDSPTGKTNDLVLSGLQARSVVMDDAAGYVRYVLIAGSAPSSVWVDVAPQPSVGPAGSASVPGGLGPVAAVSVTNQATLSGLAQTIDGVALSSANMRVFLAKQTTASQQGIWLTQAGNWTRPADWATGMTIPLGTRIFVAPGGTANFDTYGSEWYVDSASDVVDTGTINLYPVIQKGQQALTSASPSTATVSNLFIKSATKSIIALTEVTNQANNTLKGVLSTGFGSGSLAITGANTNTDTIAWMVRQG